MEMQDPSQKMLRMTEKRCPELHAEHGALWVLRGSIRQNFCSWTEGRQKRISLYEELDLVKFGRRGEAF
jgi:hypothetical protein